MISKIERNDRLARSINALLKKPLEPYTKETGNVAQVGSYHVDRAYGGAALECICNPAGACVVIIARCTEEELYERLTAMRNGIIMGMAHIPPHAGNNSEDDDNE